MANSKVMLAINTLFICFLAETNSYVLQNHLNDIGFGNLSFAESLRGGIPDSMDWRKFQGVTAVRDQGECRACWAFSITGCLESQVLIKHKMAIDLSEQMLIDCVKNGGCSNDGSLIEGFVNLVQDIGGLAFERDYPYRNQPRPGQCRDYHSMKKLPVIGFSRVASDEEQMRQYVARVGPLAAAINSKSMRKYSGDGSIDAPNWQDCRSDELDHTVLIVGYDTSVMDGVEIPFWIIKNSWGAGWGNEGFYYLERGQNSCGIASDVVYGIIA